MAELKNTWKARYFDEAGNEIDSYFSSIKAFEASVDVFADYVKIIDRQKKSDHVYHYNCVTTAGREFKICLFRKTLNNGAFLVHA